jgi:molybdopterin-guanine dinucleotide biosynthesis protein A
MTSEAETIVGVVLAGGASRRMGRDKASLVFEGEPLALRAARKLSAITGTVVIADRGRGTAPGFPSIEDGPGGGPAAAILGAAALYPSASLLVLACDLPHVPAELLRALVALDPQADLVIPRSPRGLEPLAALFRPRVLEALAEQVALGEYALHPLTRRDDLTATICGEEDLARWEPLEAVFRNWNRPGDLV